MEGLGNPTKQKILVVCGPTAGGKTELALQLSKCLSGEMVGADSMQIYQGLPIGTAALLPENAQGVAQNLVGFLSPEKPYSVAEYVVDAKACIAEITKRGHLPVVCGGTGLYISSLVNGIVFSKDKPEPAVRERLAQELQQKGACFMLERLSKLDAAYAAKLHVSDEKRIIRALEQLELTGKTYAQRAVESLPTEMPYNACCIGLNFSRREDLYTQIERRVDAMLRQGILQEAEWVYANKERFVTAAQAIGYKEFFPYFEGRQPMEACVQKLKQATRNYAKRQLTWFNNMPQIHWLRADSSTLLSDAQQLAAAFLHA